LYAEGLLVKKKKKEKEKHKLSRVDLSQLCVLKTPSLKKNAKED